MAERVGDSNPRNLSDQRFSKPPLSTTQPPLQRIFYVLLVFLEPQGYLIARQVDVEIECTAEALDQGDGAGACAGSRVPDLADQVCGQRAIDDTRHR